jgi:hypothetical protein
MLLILDQRTRGQISRLCFQMMTLENRVDLSICLVPDFNTRGNNESGDKGGTCPFEIVNTNSVSITGGQRLSGKCNDPKTRTIAK